MNAILVLMVPMWPFEREAFTSMEAVIPMQVLRNIFGFLPEQPFIPLAAEDIDG